MRCGAPALVVAVGTALTIDLLDADGRHRGGRIAPSPALMREALHARATHLPVGGGTYAEFADDTEAALASGCEGAALALIERSQHGARRCSMRATTVVAWRRRVGAAAATTDADTHRVCCWKGWRAGRGSNPQPARTVIVSIGSTLAGTLD